MGVRIPPGLPVSYIGYIDEWGRRMEVGAGYRKGVEFLREVRVEVRKVSWPTRKETVASTAVVLVAVFFIAIYLGLVDLGLSRLIGQFIR